jgi:hypothetical protein
VRRIIAWAVPLALVCGLAFGQDLPAGEPSLDELKAEVAQLTRVVADQERRLEDLENAPVAQPGPPGRARRAGTSDQERRISELEKTVRQLQAALAPQPKRIPSPTPLWQMPVNWGFVKKEMSEANVVELLGPPARIQSVVDVRILYYQPDAKSTTPLHGSVTLKDDRVVALEPPDF